MPDEATDPALPSDALAEAPRPTNGPSMDWEHRGLYDNVRKTLFAL